MLKFSFSNGWEDRGALKIICRIKNPHLTYLIIEKLLFSAASRLGNHYLTSCPILNNLIFYPSASFCTSSIFSLSYHEKSGSYVASRIFILTSPILMYLINRNLHYLSHQDWKILILEPLALYGIILSCPILSFLNLININLDYLSHQDLAFLLCQPLVLSYIVLSASFCPTLSFINLPHIALYLFFILSYLILSYLILSYLILRNLDYLSHQDLAFLLRQPLVLSYIVLSFVPLPQPVLLYLLSICLILYVIFYL